MSLFLKDLLYDLREKRLWPAAALMLLAIVAVPAVLLRSPADEAPAPPVATGGSAAEAQAAAVALATDDEVPASSLDSFSPKDPFQPRGPAAPAPPAQQGAAASEPAGGSGVSAPGGGSSGGSSSGSTSLGGGSAPASGGSPAAPPVQADPVLYTYQIDVRFGRRGKERTSRGVDRMEPLPSSKNPLLVFLGTSASGRSAVFLVDQSLEQRGEGICRPNRGNCSLLYLRDDGDHDLHFFTDTEGRGYALRLLGIDLVPVAEALEQEKQEAADARRSRTTRDDHRARWPFNVAPFADAAR